MICTGIALVAQGQFSNEWINFGQSYYKVPVVKNGIYRLTQADLLAAGVPVGAIDPRRINLFHRGAEQAILVQGQTDAVFDPGDYIEFYGKRNDGTLDADLYSPPGAQPHSYYSLYSDTSAYFLTWNPLPVLGKRISSFFEVNSSGIPVEAAHADQHLVVYANEFSNVGDIQHTTFGIGEGWTGSLICTVSSGCTGQQDFLIDNLVRPVPVAGAPQLEILLTGRGEMSHQAEVYAGVNGGSTRLLTTKSFFGYETVTLTIPLIWPDIGIDGKMTVRVKLTATGVRDQVSVSYLKVTFPQDCNMNLSSEKTYTLLSNPGGKSYVEIQNSPAGTRIFDITDSDNLVLIGSVPVAGGIGAVVPNTSGGRKLFASSITNSTSLHKITFRLMPASVANYIVISNRSLMKPALGYSDAVGAYAAYRASPEGGSYDTLTVPIDQLYNQFNFGETSPRAIYQFMKYMVSGGDPKFLFLVGKGLEASEGFYRKTTFLPSDFRDLVPSAGIPASDMAFTAGLGGTAHVPAVPTGRLSASTPNQVAAYLNKVKESEALPFSEMWRKDLLHLSGGINPGEPQVFRQYVDGFKAIAEDFYFGGKTETISKQTLNVELISVKDQVNKGLSLITFYGHSGPGTIDIDIGYVSDPTLGYQNSGKYPGFLINGCNAGRFFDNRVTFGEDWILTANKGAKAFIAHSSFGLASALRQYSELFYTVAFGDSSFIHKSVGEVQKETAGRYLAAHGNGTTSVTQVQQMVLLGDPAVQLFGASKPDYEINAGSLAVTSLDGNAITSRSDSFAIDIRVRNFGRADRAPIKVRVKRTMSDNSSLNYDSTYSPVLYTETLRMIIRKGNTDNASGNTLFTVYIDADQNINELNEGNNSSSINYFIPANGSKNLFPAPFSVVSTGSTDLVFQHTDISSGARNFTVEVDTAATFDSPFLNRKTIAAAGLARMALPLLADDSLVYYWRTKLKEPLPGESPGWTTSSFAHITNGDEGWAQLKFPQFIENDTLGLTWNSATQRLEFLSTVSTVDVTTFGDANPLSPSGVSLKINQEEFNVSSQGQPCRNNTLNLVAFDKYSTAPYAGIPFNFSDPRSCGREPQIINSFTAPELELVTDGLAQWIANVKPGDSVVVFSIGDAGYAMWSAGVNLQLEQLGIGAFQLTGLQPGEPFAIFGRKGTVGGSAQVFRPAGSPPDAQQITVNKTVTGRFSEGSLVSPLIGPAFSWGVLTATLTGTTSNDVFGVDVTGITLSGQEMILKQGLTGTQPIGDIDATAYPFLSLTMNTGDQVDLTPAQLGKLIVTYVPVAEGVLTYDGLLDEVSVQEGEIWKSTYGFTNISNRTFSDSLTVQADAFSSEKHLLDRQTFRIKAPVPGDTTTFDVKVNTRGKGGSNDITVFVNPRIIPEVYYDNNILPLYRHLQVQADDLGPVLDVTIDGRHTIDGDMVSASPAILAQVIDRNPFLLKTDTVGVDLFLRYPCEDEFDCAFKRIDFSNPDVSWSPATATEEFHVLYQPKNLALGEYVLKINASDANGNLSGDKPYELSFVVGDESGFVLQSVFPNPSVETFNFKLFIGGSAPNDFRLDIYSSMGSAVRLFGNESLPLLHVGTNVISIAAVDANGFPLPAGIYLFRFTVAVGGKEITRSGRLVVLSQ